MAKLIETFPLKSGKEVSVYDLGNYSFEFQIKSSNNEVHKFTFHGSQSGVNAGSTPGNDHANYTQDENEALTTFNQLQSRKGF